MKRSKFIQIYSFTIIVLVVSILLSASLGATNYGIFETVHSLIYLDNFIINEYRLPRILLGLLVGSSLAISGAIIQGVIRNPLASPDVLGVTKGASLSAVIIIILFPNAPLFYLPVSSFIGGLIVSIILALLISRYNIKGAHLALVGLAIGAVCMAVVQYLLIRNPIEANQALIWLTGSLYGHNINHVYILLPWYFITVPILLFLSYQLDILALGEDVALSLGSNVKFLKILILLIAIIIASASIAVVGGLSFLGLISPHIARFIVGHRYLHIIVMSGLIGSILLTLSDTIGRNIAPPIDIPVGVIIAILGAPYFLYVLKKI